MRNRRTQLEDLKTGDDRPLPVNLKAQISRELDRLEVVLQQLQVVEAERDPLLEPASEASPAPAAMLAQLQGIRPELATILYTEGLVRRLDHRPQVPAY